MKKIAFITLLTLTMVRFTHQSFAQGILPSGSLPPAGWTGAWPPMPSPNPDYQPPVQPPRYPYPSPPEIVLPDQGVFATTAGLTPVATPEPTTVGLFAVGGMAAFFWRRRVCVGNAV
jgi:PEP-CTERM motif